LVQSRFYKGCDDVCARGRLGFSQARSLGKVSFRRGMLLEQNGTDARGKKQNTRKANKKPTNITIKFSRSFVSLTGHKMFLAPTVLTKEFSQSLPIEMSLKIEIIPWTLATATFIILILKNKKFKTQSLNRGSRSDCKSNSSKRDRFRKRWERQSVFHAALR